MTQAILFVAVSEHHLQQGKMRCWLLLLLCGTAVSALSHDSAGKPPPMSKLKFQQKFQKSFVQPLDSSDFAMDQLKDTLKEIQGSVDTALS